LDFFLILKNISTFALSNFYRRLMNTFSHISPLRRDAINRVSTLNTKHLQVWHAFCATPCENVERERERESSRNGCFDTRYIRRGVPLRSPNYIHRTHTPKYHASNQCHTFKKTRKDVLYECPSRFCCKFRELYLYHSFCSENQYYTSRTYHSKVVMCGFLF
jgi:hypothetical protein